jgi:hypothetical protein
LRLIQQADSVIDAWPNGIRPLTAADLTDEVDKASNGAAWASLLILSKILSPNAGGRGDVNVRELQQVAGQKYVHFTNPTGAPGFKEDVIAGARIAEHHLAVSGKLGNARVLVEFARATGYENILPSDAAIIQLVPR